MSRPLSVANLGAVQLQADVGALDATLRGGTILTTTMNPLNPDGMVDGYYCVRAQADKIERGQPCALGPARHAVVAN